MYGDYEKIGKQTYLRLVAGEGEVRDDFACRMISEVEIPGLIRLYYAPADGHDIYKYNITQYTRLDEFSENYVSSEEMIEILKKVISTVRDTANYALNPDAIIMSKYSIYLNKNTMDVRMIYVPTSTGCGDVFSGIKEMVMDLISAAVYKDEKLTGLYNKMSEGEIRNLDELEREIDGLQVIRMTDATMDVSSLNPDDDSIKTVPEKNKKFGHNLKKLRKNEGVKWGLKKTPKKDDKEMVSINVPVF